MKHILQKILWGNNAKRPERIPFVVIWGSYWIVILILWAALYLFCLLADSTDSAPTGWTAITVGSILGHAFDPIISVIVSLFIWILPRLPKMVSRVLQEPQVETAEQFMKSRLPQIDPKNVSTSFLDAKSRAEGGDDQAQPP